jgi:Tfp pilus assembly protein PilZ
MSSDGTRDAPVIVLRVVIRSPDVETFVAKYSRFVKDDRIFIFTKSSQPVGTRVRFTLQLADAGTALLVGQGVVTRVRQETGDPGRPPGMEVKFAPLGEESARMVARMLAHRAEELEAALPPAPVLPGAAPVEMPAQRAAATEPNEASPVVTETRADPGSEEASTLVRDRIEKRSSPTGGAISAEPTPLPAPLPLPPILTPPFGSQPNTLHPTANASGATPLPPPAPAGMAAPALPVLHYTAPSLPALAEEATRDSERGAVDEKRARLSASGRVVVEPAPSLPVLDGTSPAMEAIVRDERPASTDEMETTDRVAPLAPRTRRASVEDEHVVDQPPRVGESWVGPLPAPPGAPPPPPTAGTVPANPFSDISDGAIEYFIEWSVEQSRQAPDKGRLAKAKFGNVSMRPPRAERGPRPAWVLMAAGVVVGLAFGAPLGALGMWRYRAAVSSALGLNAPGAAEGAVAKAPAPTAATTAAATTAAATTTTATTPATTPATAATATTTAATTTTASAAASPTAPPARDEPSDSAARNLSGRPRPAATAAATTTPAAAGPVASDDDERAKARARGKLAVLRVLSTPEGGEVTVKGTSAATAQRYGTTPVDIELAPGHRYDVVVTVAGFPPWKRRINLTAPSTEVVAKFK